MTRRMYDAVEWQKIPANAQMVAGYVDGAFAWPPRAWARFPNARHVRISVIPPGDPVHAGVLDVESGAASVSDAAPFIRARHKAGHRAVIYVQRSLVDDVRHACKGLAFGLWVADWTGEPHRLADMRNVVAIQWDGGVNKPFDISQVFDATWHPGPQKHNAAEADAAGADGVELPLDGAVAPDPDTAAQAAAVEAPPEQAAAPDGPWRRLTRMLSRDR